MPDAIIVEQDGGVMTITLNRPDVLNAVNDQLAKELHDALRQASREAAVRCLVLTGAGRGFCSGQDLRGRAAGDLSYREHLRATYNPVILLMRTIEKPVIAAVNGDAVGLGATIALACDVIFMADTARIGDPHVKVGLVPGDGGAAIWPLLVGPHRAKEYLMSGDLVPAAEADRIGLVNHVVPAEKVLDEALAFADRLAKGATLAIRFAKIAVQRAVLQSVFNSMDLGLALEAMTGQSRDHNEAVTAFREKRRPTFEGR